MEVISIRACAGAPGRDRAAGRARGRARPGARSRGPAVGSAGLSRLAGRRAAGRHGRRLVPDGRGAGRDRDARRLSGSPSGSSGRRPGTIAAARPSRSRPGRSAASCSWAMTTGRGRGCRSSTRLVPAAGRSATEAAVIRSAILVTGRQRRHRAPRRPRHARGPGRLAPRDRRRDGRAGPAGAGAGSRARPDLRHGPALGAGRPPRRRDLWRAGVPDPDRRSGDRPRRLDGWHRTRDRHDRGAGARLWRVPGLPVLGGRGRRLGRGGDRGDRRGSRGARGRLAGLRARGPRGPAGPSDRIASGTLPGPMATRPIATGRGRRAGMDLPANDVLLVAAGQRPDPSTARRFDPATSSVEPVSEVQR